MASEKKGCLQDGESARDREFYEQRSREEATTVLLIDDGNRRLMDVLAEKGYGVIHLAAKDATPGMLMWLTGSMSIGRRKTALIADIPREDAEAVAGSIWELFSAMRVVIVDANVKRPKIGLADRCDIVVPADPVQILGVLECYRIPMQIKSKKILLVDGEKEQYWYREQLEGCGREVHFMRQGDMALRRMKSERYGAVVIGPKIRQGTEQVGVIELALKALVLQPNVPVIVLRDGNDHEEMRPGITIIADRFDALFAELQRRIAQ